MTPAAAEAADPPPSVGWTTTCVAVMVVPLVVPSTRTLSPVVTALAAVELVPFWYVVDVASLTVTFWPADVDMVKPDVLTLETVPDAPPAAGPDRALDPAPPAAVEEDVAVVEGDVAFAEGDVAQPANSATAPIDAAATIHRRLGLDNNRRAFGRRGVAIVSWELAGSQSFMMAFLPC